MGCSKYNNDFKQRVIESGVLKLYKDKKKENYKSSFAWCESEDTQHTGELIFTAVNDNYFQWMLYCKEHQELDCAMRLANSEGRKWRRVYEKINELVATGRAVFITLTFTDNVLSKTSALTRRRYVARYLKQFSNVYVANIDFSPVKHREHYHCVIDNRVDMSKWSYGFVYAEQVRTQDYNAKRVSKYVAKLSNHALKVKALSTRLIYSRDTI